MVTTELVKPPSEFDWDAASFASAALISAKFFPSISPVAVAAYGLCNSIIIAAGNKFANIANRTSLLKKTVVVVLSLSVGALVAPVISNLIAIPVTSQEALTIAGMNLVIKATNYALTKCFKFYQTSDIRKEHCVVNPALSLEEKKSHALVFYANDFPPQEKVYNPAEFVLPKTIEKETCTNNQVRWLHLAIQNGVFSKNQLDELSWLAKRFYDLKLPAPQPTFRTKYEHVLRGKTPSEIEKFARNIQYFNNNPKQWNALPLYQQFLYAKYFSVYFKRAFRADFTSYYNVFTLDHLVLPSNLDTPHKKEAYLASWGRQYYQHHLDEWKSLDLAKQIQLNACFSTSNSYTMLLYPKNDRAEGEALEKLYKQYSHRRTDWTWHMLPQELQKKLNQKFALQDGCKMILSFEERVEDLKKRVNTNTTFYKHLAKFGARIFSQFPRIQTNLNTKANVDHGTEIINNDYVARFSKILQKNPSLKAKLSPDEKVSFYSRIEELWISLDKDQSQYIQGQFLSKTCTAISQLAANATFFGILAAHATITPAISPFLLPYYGIAAGVNLLAAKLLYKNTDKPNRFAKYLIKSFEDETKSEKQESSEELQLSSSISTTVNWLGLGLIGLLASAAASQALTKYTEGPFLKALENNPACPLDGKETIETFRACSDDQCIRKAYRETSRIVHSDKKNPCNDEVFYALTDLRNAHLQN